MPEPKVVGYSVELMRAAGQEFYNMLPEGHAEFPGQLMLHQLWGNPFFALVKPVYNR
jgi:hypothetical protein